MASLRKPIGKPIASPFGPSNLLPLLPTLLLLEMGTHAHYSLWALQAGVSERGWAPGAAAPSAALLCLWHLAPANEALD